MRWLRCIYPGTSTPASDVTPPPIIPEPPKETPPDNRKSNQAAILAQAQRLAETMALPAFAPVVFGLAWRESVGDWDLPMQGLLKRKGRAGELGPWQITQGYMEDALRAHHRSNPPGFADTPSFDTLDGQANALRWYYRVHGNTIEGFWAIHHYGPSGYSVNAGPDERLQYEVGYLDGLDQYRDIMNKTVGRE